MQDFWLSEKADEIQFFAERKDMKTFRDALKTLYGPKSSGTIPSALIRPSINDEAINRLPRTEYHSLLDEFSTVPEKVKAINLLSSGKAPGSDAIHAEIYKAGISPVAEKLTDLFHIIRRKEIIPLEFK